MRAKEHRLEPRISRLEWLVVVATVVIVPLWVSRHGDDPFRTPKLLLFRGAGIVLAALMASSAIARRDRGKPDEVQRDTYFHLSVAIAGWTLLAAFHSVELGISMASALTVMAAMLMFHASRRCAWHQAASWIVFPAPLLVAAIAMLQTTRWNKAIATMLVGPISEAELARSSPISLLGYRTDVGTYLVAPALCAFAFFLAERKESTRRLSIVVAAILIGGVVATFTITAIGALAVSLLAMAMLRSRKAAVLALVTVAVAAVIAGAMYPPLRERVVRIHRNVVERNLDAAMTRRLISFLAAGQMIAREPLIGVGPGTFKKEYFEHRIIAARRHAGLLGGGGSIDVFEEAHNDHLQVAAEAGIPAWILFLLAGGAIARLSFARWRATPVPERGEVARLLSLPLMVSLFVLALAQTPLQLAVTIATYSHLAGLCVAWSAPSRE